MIKTYQDTTNETTHTELHVDLTQVKAVRVQHFHHGKKYQHTVVEWLGTGAVASMSYGAAERAVQDWKECKKQKVTGE